MPATVTIGSGSIPMGYARNNIQWRLRFMRGRFQPGIFLLNPAFCFTVLATLSENILLNYSSF